MCKLGLAAAGLTTATWANLKMQNSAENYNHPPTCSYRAPHLIFFQSSSSSTHRNKSEQHHSGSTRGGPSPIFLSLSQAWALKVEPKKARARHDWPSSHWGSKHFLRFSVKILDKISQIKAFKPGPSLENSTAELLKTGPRFCLVLCKPKFRPGLRVWA